MNPAKSALGRGQGVIVLHEFRGDRELDEGLCAVAFREEPTVIAEARGVMTTTPESGVRSNLKCEPAVEFIF